MNKIKPYYINKIPIIQTLKLIQGQERLTGNIANEKTDGISEVSAISKGIEIGIQVAIDLISKEPTEDAAEVVHGEWITLDECSNAGVYCSKCKKKVYKENYANVNPKSNYCPNCGAKMDEGKE